MVQPSLGQNIGLIIFFGKASQRHFHLRQILTHHWTTKRKIDTKPILESVEV